MVEPATLRRIQRYFFMLTLLTFAFFAFVLLLLLNILYIVTIVFLPPQSWALKFLTETESTEATTTIVDDDNCAQLLRYYNHGVINGVSRGIKSLWHLLASHFTFFYFIPIIGADVMLGTIFLFFFGGSSPYSKKQRKRRRRRSTYWGWGDSSEKIEEAISNLFNIIRIWIVPIFSGYIYSVNNEERQSPCMRLIDVVQLVALLTLSFRRGYALRLTEVRKKAANSGHPIRMSLILYTISVFFEDFWNRAAIRTFFATIILKLADNWSNWALSLHIPMLGMLFAETECVACPMFAPCPIERIIFAEHFFITLIAYFLRMYQHWLGLQIQRRLRRFSNGIARNKQKSGHEITEEADEVLDYDYGQFVDWFFATTVLRSFYERFVPMLHRLFEELEIRMNSTIAAFMYTL